MSDKKMVPVTDSAIKPTARIEHNSANKPTARLVPPVPPKKK